VAPTEEWLYNSYAKYSCAQPYSLLGSVYRQCLANGEDLYWQHEQPRCTDVCDNVPLEQRRACGGAYTTEKECGEMGCCYKAEAEAGQKTGAGPLCFKRPVPIYMVYAGDKPVVSDGQGFETLQDYSLEGCAIHCSHGTSLRCKSHGYQKTSYDEEQDVQRHSCHMQDKSRRQMIDDSEMSHGNTGYDFYDQLNIATSNEEVVEYNDGDVISKQYVGCFDDSSVLRDLEHHVWSANHNTPDKCVTACRQQGFHFAGLQASTDCYCGNRLLRLYNESDNCNAPCSGDVGTTCGGELANSVYRVPFDSRYFGCYNENADIPDLPVIIWT